MAKSKTAPDAEAIAAFDVIYWNWRKAQWACSDPFFDDSDKTTEALGQALYAAEDALAAASTPRRTQLKHKFHYLDFSIESGNDGDIAAAVASIKADLRRWGFDLPDKPDMPWHRTAKEVEQVS